MEQQSNDQKGRAVVSISRKKFVLINKAVEEITSNPDMSKTIMDTIAKIIGFDINAKASYNPEVVKKRYETFKIKAKELGISVYELSGHKAIYEKKKIELNKRRTQT